MIYTEVSQYMSHFIGLYVISLYEPCEAPVCDVLQSVGSVSVINVGAVKCLSRAKRSSPNKLIKTWTQSCRGNEIIFELRVINTWTHTQTQRRWKKISILAKVYHLKVQKHPPYVSSGDTHTSESLWALWMKFSVFKLIQVCLKFVSRSNIWRLSFQQQED